MREKSQPKNEFKLDQVESRVIPCTRTREHQRNASVSGNKTLRSTSTATNATANTIAMVNGVRTIRARVTAIAIRIE